MVRTQIQVTRAQHEQLRALAKREGVSMRELVRRAVDALLAGTPNDRQAVVRARALAVVGCFEGGAGDVSKAHDKYLVQAFEA